MAKKKYYILIPVILLIIILCFIPHQKKEMTISYNSDIKGLHPGKRYAVVTALYTKNEDKYDPIQIYGKDLFATKIFVADDTKKMIKIEYPVFIKDLEMAIPDKETYLYEKTTLFENGVKIQEGDYNKIDSFWFEKNKKGVSEQ